MKYNFDEIVNRENTDSVKYDLRKIIFDKEDVIPMWVADMDFKTPDFIINALKKRLTHEIFGYSFRSKKYFGSIINWFKRRHKWDLEEDWISFSPGVVPGVNMAIMAYTEPGDKVIVQTPVYFPFFSAIENNNRVQLENTLVLNKGRYFINFDDLELKLKEAKMFILSNPHNPGGSVWTKEELKRIGELCVKHNVIILSDDIHADLVFKEFTYIPIASLSKEIADITITFIAPSKTFNLAALATSSLVCSNKKLKDKFDKVLDTIHVGMGNVFGTEASIAAYNHGDKWLDQLMEYLSANLDYLDNYLKQNIPQVKMIRPEGTYLVWLDCTDLNLSDKKLKDFFINKAELGLNVGTMFGTGGNGFMRMNVACPQQTISEALIRLKKAIVKL